MTDVDGDDDDELLHSESVRSQRELNPAAQFLNQAGLARAAAAASLPTLSVKRVLVTPTATWSTFVDSSIYETVVTREIATEVPIIVRGVRIKTTIIEQETEKGDYKSTENSYFSGFFSRNAGKYLSLLVTATELLTSSILITPTPTWRAITLTIAPTASKLLRAGVLRHQGRKAVSHASAPEWNRQRLRHGTGTVLTEEAVCHSQKANYLFFLETSVQTCKQHPEN